MRNFVRNKVAPVTFNAKYYVYIRHENLFVLGVAIIQVKEHPFL